MKKGEDMKADNKKRPKKFKKLFLGMAAGFLLLLCGGIIAIYFLPDNEIDVSPAEKEKIDEFLGAVTQPENIDAAGWASLSGFLRKVPDKVKKPLIRTVTRKSIEELRENFKGLKEEEKKKKVMEIMNDIENYEISSETYKIFDEAFMREGLAVYMKEVSPQERALYDPIIHTFIRRLNSGRGMAKK